MGGFRSFFISNGGPGSPCHQDCPCRNSTCHATCEAYIQYEKIREAFRNKCFMESDNRYTVGKKYTQAFFDRKAKLKRDGKQGDR